MAWISEEVEQWVENVFPGEVWLEGGDGGRRARVCVSLSGSPGWGQMNVWVWAAADTSLLA